MPRLPLAKVIERLEKAHGRSRASRSTDPWSLILRENVAYLADDERREAALALLERTVGSTPDDLLAASDEQLLAVASHGILAETFVEKLRRCARIAIEEFGGDLRSIPKLPIAQAKKALRKFPGIGDPGAEKILMLAGALKVLALESNGLRVLVRLGFAREQKSYSTTYRLVRAAVEPETTRDTTWLARAHELLRRHGQEVCKRTKPRCGACVLNADCPARESPALA